MPQTVGSAIIAAVTPVIQKSQHPPQPPQPPPSQLSPPVCIVLPRVSRAGQTLSTTTGLWRPAPDLFYYGWLRNGAGIVGAMANTYDLLDTDGGASFSSVVLGRNSAGPGVAVASSNSIVVD